jgi:hypothetical protein
MKNSNLQLLMRVIILGVILFAPFLSYSQDAGKAERTKPTEIKATDLLETVRVIGRLGVALGQVVRVEGKVTSPPGKANITAIFFTVQKVNGRALAEPQTFRIGPAYGELERSKMESKTTFHCFESGRFTGLPEEVFKYIPQPATTDFYFETFLVGPLESLNKPEP